MTTREKVVVSAYTGFMMCKWDELHEYLEELMQRPVYTHELAGEGFEELVREKAKPEFLEICAS